MDTLPPLRAVFLDRDGVLNVDHGYTHDPADLVWVEGAREAVAALNRAGLQVMVVTNQSGVGRGFFDEAAVHRFHAALQEGLALIGGKIDAFYLCPFHEDATLEAYRVADHPDRKPNPGMILRGLSDAGLHPEEAVMIGDKAGDVEAGHRAGMPAYLFAGGSLHGFIVDKLGERVPGLK